MFYENIVPNALAEGAVFGRFFRLRFLQIKNFDSEESFELLETVRQLPEHDRDAVYLYYYEEYTIREIAKILGEREGTIRSRLSRARKKLRAIMEGEAYEQVL